LSATNEIATLEACTLAWLYEFDMQKNLHFGPAVQKNT